MKFAFLLLLMCSCATYDYGQEPESEEKIELHYTVNVDSCEQDIDSLLSDLEHCEKRNESALTQARKANDELARVRLLLEECQAEYNQ